MKFRDTYGNLLQYGDIVENLDTHDIGVIQRSSINDSPILYIIKEFSWRDMQYKNVKYCTSPICNERSFIPKHSKLYWRLHNYCIPQIELLQHGERNRRFKDI